MESMALFQPLFSRFLHIRIDFRERVVNLTPYSIGGNPCAGSDAVQAHVSNGIIFLQASIQSREGYLLIDTGSAYNAVAGSVAQSLRLSDPLAALIDSQTTNGLIQGQPGGAATFQIGNRNILKPIVR